MVGLADAVTGLGGLNAALDPQAPALSRGETQLLCLARAVLRDAPVLVLDESNASVDDATDAAMEALVRRFVAGDVGLTRRRRTLVQVRSGGQCGRQGWLGAAACSGGDSAGWSRECRPCAQRASHAAEAWPAPPAPQVSHKPTGLLDRDQVVVMEGGRAAEAGTPADLLAQPGSHFGALMAAIAGGGE